MKEVKTKSVEEKDSKVVSPVSRNIQVSAELFRLMKLVEEKGLTPFPILLNRKQKQTLKELDI